MSPSTISPAFFRFHLHLSFPFTRSIRQPQFNATSKTAFLEPSVIALHPFLWLNTEDLHRRTLPLLLPYPSLFIQRLYHFFSPSARAAVSIPLFRIPRPG